MDNVLISCENVTLGYENQKVVENLEFQVLPADYMCIVGENGSGKSTLIKSLLGLIKPLDGSIVISDHLKKGSIGYLPQQTQAQRDFPATVWEVVLSGYLSAGKNRFFYSQEEKLKALFNMKRLQIEELKKKSYRELSGGQQQRVLLARALCAAENKSGKSRLLVLDEPVTGLDPSATLELYKSLQELNRKEKMTIIMVSHDIEKALKECKRILHLGHKESFCGTVEEYLESEIGQKFTGGGKT